MAFVGKVKAGSGTGPVGSSLYGYCITPANQAAKSATVDGLDTLFLGLTVHIKFTNSNEAENPTLTIPTVGATAIPIMRYGSTPPGKSSPKVSWQANSVLALTYDGNFWQMNGWLNDDTTYEDATRETHGLLTAAGKRKLDDLNSDSSLVFGVPNGVPVSHEAWQADSTYLNLGYGFKADITCNGVTVNHIPSVTFRPADLNAYAFAPIAVSGANTVTVYCGIKPAVDITIPSIVATRSSSV